MFIARRTGSSFFKDIFAIPYISGTLMKKLLVAGFVVAGLNGAAFAADMPLKAPPPAVVAANWTGFYVGVVAGGEIGQTSTSFIFANIPGLPGTPTPVSPPATTPT